MCGLINVDAISERLQVPVRKNALLERDVLNEIVGNDACGVVHVCLFSACVRRARVCSIDLGGSLGLFTGQHIPTATFGCAV